MNNLKLLALPLFFILSIAACKTPKEQIVGSETDNQKPSFEGKIIYDLKMEDKSGEMTQELMKAFMGDEQTYTFKGRKYKSELNGMIKMVQTYLGGDTLYNQVGAAQQLLWIDATSNPEKLIEYSIERQVEKVAGEMCDLLTIKSDKGLIKYYFSDRYYVKPEAFKNHKYGFWGFCIEKTGSIPLKSISDMDDMYIEITAKEVKEMKIDDSEFSLPNLPRQESPEK